MRAAAPGWARLGAGERAGLLAEVSTSAAASAPEWVRLCCEAKRVPVDSAAGGEEWLAGPAVTLRLLRLLRASLHDVAAGRLPGLPGPARPDGPDTLVVPVFPAGPSDRLLFPGVRGSARVAVAPGEALRAAGRRSAGVEPSVGGPARAAAYRGPRPGRVAVVLGAGNVSAIPLLDALTYLVVEGCAVVVKLSPVNDYLAEVFRAAFGPLVAPGYLRFVSGGAAVGESLATADGVDVVHLTGSDRSFDALVWGDPAGKAAGRRRLDRPVTAELGNVTPVVVVPGRWTAAELAHQGAVVASMLANNAGFNCVSARVLVTAAGWERRAELLSAVGHAFAAVPARYGYYPGAAAAWAQVRAAHPRARAWGSPGDGRLPWTLVTGLASDAAVEPCFDAEVFAPVLAETALPGPADPARFLDAAVAFCNERLWGSLAVALLVHPASLRDPATAAAFKRAVDRLRYGVVTVNTWPGLAFGLGSLPWGAAPGGTAERIGSGLGSVHNSFLLDHPVKAVLGAPFHGRTRPPWLATHRQAATLGRRYARWEARATPGRLAAVLWSGARG